jgi:hypothetical protein
MVEIKDKERAVIEFTCIPDISIEKAQELYEIGFRHLKELLAFSLGDEAKEKGLVEVLNYWILSQFLTLEDKDIPTNKFKCQFCKGTVFADEEECSDCGALLLEEILEVEMEEVHRGLQGMIDAIIANPEPAKEFLEGKGTAVDVTAEEVEVESEKLERGISAIPIIPKEEGKNYIILISPLGEHEDKKDKILKDFAGLGAGEALDISISEGNITNQQEDAVKNVVNKFIGEQDFNNLPTNNFLVLNLKIASFSESKAAIAIEDNRHFLSSMDEIRIDDQSVMDIGDVLYDAELIKEVRKTGDKVVLDGISFNNDPISFLVVKESLPILKEKPDLKMRILDVVVNSNYIDSGSHNELLRLLQEWEV